MSNFCAGKCHFAAKSTGAINQLLLGLLVLSKSQTSRGKYANYSRRQSHEGEGIIRIFAL